MKTYGSKKRGRDVLTPGVAGAPLALRPVTSGGNSPAPHAYALGSSAIKKEPAFTKQHGGLPLLPSHKGATRVNALMALAEKPRTAEGQPGPASKTRVIAGSGPALDVANVPMPFAQAAGAAKAGVRPVQAIRQHVSKPPSRPQSSPASTAIIGQGCSTAVSRNRLVTSVFHRQTTGCFPTTAQYQREMKPPPTTTQLDVRSLSRPWRPFTRSLDGMTADMRVLLERVQPALKGVVLLGFTRLGDGLLSYSWEETEEGFSALGGLGGLGGFGDSSSSMVRFELQLWSVVPSWGSLATAGSSQAHGSQPPAFGVDLITAFPLFQEGSAWKDWRREAATATSHSYASAARARGSGGQQHRHLAVSAAGGSDISSASEEDTSLEGFDEDDALAFSPFEPSQVKVVVWEAGDGALVVQGSLFIPTASANARDAGRCSLPRTCHITIVPPIDTGLLSTMVRLNSLTKAERAFHDKREVVAAIMATRDADEADADRVNPAATTVVRYAPIPVRPSAHSYGAGAGTGVFGGGFVRCFHSSHPLAYPYPSQSMLGLAPVPLQPYCSRLVINTGEGLRCITFACRPVGAGASSAGQSAAKRDEDMPAASSSAAADGSFSLHDNSGKASSVVVRGWVIDQSADKAPVPAAAPAAAPPAFRWWRDLLPKGPTPARERQGAKRLPLLSSRQLPMAWGDASLGGREPALSFLSPAPYRQLHCARDRHHSLTGPSTPMEAQSLYAALDHCWGLEQASRQHHRVDDDGEDEDEDPRLRFFTGDVKVLAACDLDAEALLSRLLTSTTSSSSTKTTSSSRVHNYDIRFVTLLDSAYAAAMGLVNSSTPAGDDDEAPSTANVGLDADNGLDARCAVFTVTVDHDHLVPAAAVAAEPPAAPLAEPPAAASESAEVASAAPAEAAPSSTVAPDAFAFSSDEQDRKAEAADMCKSEGSRATNATAGAGSSGDGDGWDDVISDSRGTTTTSTAVAASTTASTTTVSSKPRLSTYGSGFTRLSAPLVTTVQQRPQQRTSSVPPQKAAAPPKAYAPPTAVKVRSLFVCLLDTVTGQVRVLEGGRLPPQLQPAFDGSLIAPASLAMAAAALHKGPQRRPFLRGSCPAGASLGSVFAPQAQGAGNGSRLRQSIEVLSRFASATTLSRLFDAGSILMPGSSGSVGFGSAGVRQLDNLNMVLGLQQQQQTAAAGSRWAAADVDAESSGDDDDDDGEDTAAGSHRQHSKPNRVVGARSLKKLLHPIYPFALIA